ncbi:hypothetical protein HDZ31DRAFT_78615 [Schizophyllum fasciatum]
MPRGLRLACQAATVAVIDTYALEDVEKQKRYISDLKSASQSLPTPVLAKIDSFARVAMAGIQESTTADSISPFIVPETFSVDSINARGPVDIPTDLASADQQSPKDVNAEDFILISIKDLAQTADVPSIFPGAAVKKGVVATKVEEGAALQARAPLPRITTFGVATNVGVR